MTCRHNLTQDQSLIHCQRMDQPLRAQEASRLGKQIIATGIVHVRIPKHAKEELDDDDMDTGDVRNLLKGGVYREAEFVNGAWRHHVDTQRMTLVIEFESETELVVVTAWRNQRR